MAATPFLAAGLEGRGVLQVELPGVEQHRRAVVEGEPELPVRDEDAGPGLCVTFGKFGQN